MGDGTQTPRRVRARAVGQHRPSRAHVPREHEEERFVLAEMRSILTSLTRGLAFDVLVARLRRRARRADQLSGAESRWSGWCCRRTRLACTRCGCRSSRCRSAWCSSRDRRSRGRRIAWRKRSFRPAFRARRFRSIRAEADVGAAVLDSCGRTLIFGGTATVDRYRGNPRVQAHGPGLLQDPDRRRPGRSTGRQFLDVMVDSVFLNSGRGCINCSGIWASRHTREIAEAHRRRLAAIAPLPPDHPDASLAAFTVPGVADAISQAIDADLQAPGVTDVTAKYRDGQPRLVKEGRADYLLPTVVHCESPDARGGEEGIHVPLRHRGRVPGRPGCWTPIGPTLVCSAITGNAELRQRLLDADAHRSAQSGPGADDPVELAAAARREPDRLPVPRAGVSDGGGMTQVRGSRFGVRRLVRG